MLKQSSSDHRDAVVLLSGGLDSMVTAALARKQGFRLNALTIDYGQRHRCEIDAARRIAGVLGVDRHIVLPLDLRAFGGSALTDDIAVPKCGPQSDIPATYVPARNLVFLSLILAWCEVIPAQDIFIGVNAIDYSGYPDCRPEFIASFSETARLATKAGVQGNSFTIHTPLQHASKADIATLAHDLQLDTGLSWSCYDPTEEGLACGECESCRLRKAGFVAAGLPDGVAYA